MAEGNYIIGVMISKKKKIVFIVEQRLRNAAWPFRLNADFLAAWPYSSNAVGSSLVL
ncbi:728_t:CDS:2 [Cetraspora pellucida]|uniref:728_t:CDS:1 n=1 Tax=Cetraspora pellucida TaxID=1433469 RepID=A0A9N9CMS9_9GLOM|nr:728_t:CDS:2 [Cetraspora pellucida]